MNAPDTLDFDHPDQLQALTGHILELAGSHEAEVAVSSGEGLSVTVRDGEREMVEHERDKTVTVTIYSDGRKGSATSTDFSPAALAETVGAASEIAKHGEADPYAGLADKQYLASSIPDLDLAHRWPLDVDAASSLALECEQAAKSVSPSIRQSDGVTVRRYGSTRAYANSNGFSGAYSATRHSISAVMIAADDAGMQRGYWYETSRDPATLGTAENIGRKAGERTVAKLGAQKIATTELPVIYESRAAGALIGHLLSAISGGAQYRKASFLLDALGERVMPGAISIEEQPHLPAGIASKAFDRNGVATCRKALVEKGTLTSYLLSAYAARRLGLEPTGNAGGPQNIIVACGERDLEALIGAQTRALLVTDLMGFGVNAVTGDYSRGASGFLIENGEIRVPVEEVTIAGNLRNMYTGIVEIGADAEANTPVRTGSILIDRMAVAGS